MTELMYFIFFATIDVLIKKFSEAIHSKIKLLLYSVLFYLVAMCVIILCLKFSIQFKPINDDVFFILVMICPMQVYLKIIMNTVNIIGRRLNTEPSKAEQFYSMFALIMTISVHALFIFQNPKTL
jgi:hypothetical protein